MIYKSVYGLMLVISAVQVCLSSLVNGENIKVLADTIITGGTVVTMDGQRHIYDDGAVVVTGDTIVAVGPRADLEARYESRETIDAKNTPGRPGIINGA